MRFIILLMITSSLLGCATTDEQGEKRPSFIGSVLKGMGQGLQDNAKRQQAKPTYNCAPDNVGGQICRPY